jgi:hypothetical protein
MAIRIASTMGLLAFAVCLIVGGLSAGNGFGTAVGRALVAMAGTLVVGLIVGLMAQKMLDEHGRTERARLAQAADGTHAPKAAEKEAESWPNGR